MSAPAPPVTAIHAARFSAREKNEDHFRIGSNAVVVLDGASAPETRTRDGGWYASTLSDILIDLLQRHDHVGLHDVVSTAIAQLLQQHRLPCPPPSSTVAALRWNTKAVSGYVLGDTTIIALRRDGSTDTLRDERLDTVAQDLRLKYQQRLREGHGYDTTHAEIIAALVDAQRKLRNVHGGYWIAETSPDAAHMGFGRVWCANDLDAVVVASDGAAAGVTAYDLATWHEVVVRVREHGAQAFLQAVHHAEHCDSSGTRWPRSKVHDDKAIVILDFAGSIRDE